LEFVLVEVEDSDYELIQNLIRFYIHDMSEFTGWSCPSNGLYGGVDDQPYYFGKTLDLEDARWLEGWAGKGYKVLVDREIAGFCLVRLFYKDARRLNDIGEFFILRKFRNKGLGRQVAHAIFDMYPGNWQVRQMVDNRPAQVFWRKTISAYTQDQFEEGLKFVDGYGEMVVQKFVSPDSHLECKWVQE
jgi:predicted acetyltransferase